MFIVVSFSYLAMKKTVHIYARKLASCSLKDNWMRYSRWTSVVSYPLPFTRQSNHWESKRDIFLFKLILREKEKSISLELVAGSLSGLLVQGYPPFQRSQNLLNLVQVSCSDAMEQCVNIFAKFSTRTSLISAIGLSQTSLSSYSSFKWLTHP